MVSFAFSIGKPDMDPEVSSTNTSSFGVMSSTFVFSGGCRIRVKKPPRFPRCVSIASSSLPPDTSYRSTKSLFGITARSFSRTLARCEAGRSVKTMREFSSRQFEEGLPHRG